MVNIDNSQLQKRGFETFTGNMDNNGGFKKLQVEGEGNANGNPIISNVLGDKMEQENMIGNNNQMQGKTQTYTGNFGHFFGTKDAVPTENSFLLGGTGTTSNANIVNHLADKAAENNEEMNK